MSTVQPNLYESIRGVASEAVGHVLVSITATVQSYDRTSQTVTVDPDVNGAFVLSDGTEVPENLPVIGGVPVMFPGGNGVSLTWDLAAGDQVLLIIRDRSHDEIDSGVAQRPVTPRSRRRFSLADAVAIPQFKAPNAPLAASAVGANKVVLALPSGYTLRAGSSSSDKALALAQQVATKLAAIELAINTLVLPVSGPTAGPPAVPPFTTTTTTSDVASTRVFADA